MLSEEGPRRVWAGMYKWPDAGGTEGRIALKERMVQRLGRDAACRAVHVGLAKLLRPSPGV